MTIQDISRRRFLGLTLSAGAVLVAAGCGGSATVASTPASPSSAPASAAAKPSSQASAAGSPAGTTGSAPASAASSGLASAKPSAAGSAPASGAAASPAGSAAASGAANHLKIGSAPLLANSGLFIGMDRGYFKDQGLDIEAVNFAQGAAAMAQPLAADQLDIANADPSAAFLNAIGRGINMKFVGDGNHSDATHKGVAFLIRKDLIDSGAVKDYPDLKGKKISPIIKGSAVDRVVHLALTKGNLKESDVDLEYIGFPDSLAAMGNKSLDGAIEVEPLITTAVEKNIAVAWKWGVDITGPSQGTVIMYGQNMAKNRQDAGKRFMVGYIKAIRDYIDAFSNGKDKQAIIGILTKNTTLKDPALYDKIQLPWFDPNGAMNIQSMKDMQQWFVSNGYVKTAANMDTTVDMSYVNAALAQVGKR